MIKPAAASIIYFINTLENMSGKLLDLRSLSGISGPLASQNKKSFYENHSKAYNFMGIAVDERRVVVGYVVSTLYTTLPLFFGWRSYARFGNNPTTPAADSLDKGGEDVAAAEVIGGDTLIINEICVDQSKQGLGIASNLLDLVFQKVEEEQVEVSSLLLSERRGKKKRNILKRVEFSVLSTNLSSELLFTKFAERMGGTSIRIGNSTYSPWGEYIDWSVEIQDDISQPFHQHRSLRPGISNTSSLKAPLLQANILKITDPFIERWSSIDGQLARNGLIQRSRQRQRDRKIL